MAERVRLVAMGQLGESALMAETAEWVARAEMEPESTILEC